MNKLLESLEKETNYCYTENGALAHKSTLSAVYDMFALGAAYRQRSVEDRINLFKKALDEDEVLALKCLFYVRDARGGQGEREFFRNCIRWLAQKRTDLIERNLRYIPEFGRWDDLYQFVGTPVEKKAFNFMKEQLVLDLECKTPSLLAKWLKSINTSSTESRKLANITRKYFNMTEKQYRKTLSYLRERIKVVEKLMSANRWNEIEFDKIPSKAGLIYKNAFARKDLIKEKYTNFIKDENTKVNAGTLYPYEVVRKAIDYFNNRRYSNAISDFNDTDRIAIGKYWDNLTDYFNGASLNALAMVDTSGSMTWGSNSVAPIDIAISLGIYCAEKTKGPFHGNYISFSRNPQLIEVEGIDFVDKVKRIYKKNLCENTNLLAAFALIRDIAYRNHLKQEDLPETIIVISDMEIDAGTSDYWCYQSSSWELQKTEMETERERWEALGYKMPKLIYWNVNARNDRILDDGPNVTYVSGASPVIFEQIMSGKTGIDLMLDKLNSERYECIK